MQGVRTELNPDPAQRPFRFGVGMTAAASRRDWIDKCRKAEDLGYDVIGVADHLGMPAPFPSLMLAAEVTDRPRVATAVLNTSFYNPALLARDVAAADQLTDGRLEVGLGTGYRKVEFDAAGIPWPSPRQRVAHLEYTVTELQRCFTDPHHMPQPSQCPGPPISIGGRGNRVLALAASEADIIGFTGFAPGNEGDTAYLADVDGITERVEYVRALLGERISRVELNILVWRVVVTNNRRAEAERLEPMRTLSADQVLGVPTVLIGKAREIADQLAEHRERFGFSYITVGEYNLEPLSQVIELLK